MKIPVTSLVTSATHLSTLSSWTATTTPTAVTLRTVPTTHALILLKSLNGALASIATETNPLKLYSLSQVVRGAQASLTIISVENVLHTATNTVEEGQLWNTIRETSLNLQMLAFDKNWFKTDLNPIANYVYFIVFSLIFFYFVGMLYKSRYHWFNVSFTIGLLLQFVGWMGRIMALRDNGDVQFYLMEIIDLSISPAFLMGGIYFMFAQMIVIHGREYSVLKPLWYSYFFISVDVLSVLIQSGGGAAAALATLHRADPGLGTDIMTAGIVFQVVAMTVFLGFWFEFLNRIYFRRWEEADDWNPSPYAKPSIANFFRYLFNAKLIREYRRNTLDLFYNPQFVSIRSRPLFDWFPLVLTISVVLIYIRYVYRIAELAQGLAGYLITHEVYLMVLEALTVAIACILFVPFHPVWTFGPLNTVKLGIIKKRVDEASHRQRWGKESIWFS